MSVSAKVVRTRGGGLSLLNANFREVAGEPILHFASRGIMY